MMAATTAASGVGVGVGNIWPPVIDGRPDMIGCFDVPSQRAEIIAACLDRGIRSMVSTQVGQLFAALTGTRAISKCIASGSGMLNIHTLDWDPEILALLGMKSEQMEELVEAFHTAPLLPEVAQSVGLPSGIPVTAGCADGALNQVAVSGVAQGVMSFSVGTSGAIRLVQNAPLIPE